jgi:hypothetical protein
LTRASSASARRSRALRTGCSATAAKTRCRSRAGGCAGGAAAPNAYWRTTERRMSRKRRARLCSNARPENSPDVLAISWIASAQETGPIPILNSSFEADVLTCSPRLRADQIFTGYAATLLAESVALASAGSSSPAAGTFLEDVIVYESGLNPVLLAISRLRSCATGAKAVHHRYQVAQAAWQRPLQRGTSTIACPQPC